MSTHLKCVLFALVAALAVVPALSIAQSSQGSATTTTSEKLEEVVVTGSLLKKELGEVAQPITVMQAQDLVLAGATNPEQIMQQFPQNQPVAVSNTSIGRGTGAGAYANLRSLGSERTLVLVGGKRMVNSPYLSIGVDLNTVPTALVERVEVFPYGGSATYGTDAEAGVVNFITPKEFAGLNTSMTATTPEAAGGGQTYLASLSGGAGSLGSDGWNVYAGGTWRKATELLATDRSFSSTGYIPSRGINYTQSTADPVNYSQPAGTIDDLVNPANPQCVGKSMLYADGIFGPRSCAYDVAARLDLMIPQEQWSVLGKASLRLGENHTVSVEYVGSDNHLTNVVSPQQVGGLSMSANNPFFPGQGITPGVAGLDPTLPIRFRWRTEELGRRESDLRGYTDRALAELEGKLGAWDYQVYAMISTSTTNIYLDSGYPNELEIPDGLTGANGAPFLNPFGPQTPAGLQYLQSIQVIGKAQSATGDLKDYGAQVSRELFRLPGGPVALAAAIEYKTESASFTNNIAVTSLVPSTFADAQDIRGDRDSYSASIEMHLPVLEHLDVGLSGRYDHYSDFGSTTNPELSLRYEPVHWLTLRGGYSTSFRAPTLYDIFRPRTIGYTSDTYNDPVLCPGGVANSAAGGITERDCNTEFNLTSGGNPKLQAENSDAYSFGFLLRPLESLAIGLDYWNFRVTGTIGPLSEQAIFEDPAKYSSHYVRCSQVPAAELAHYESCTSGGTGDPIAYIDDTLLNLGDTKTSGFDLTASWSVATALGRFGVEYRGTYVSQYEFQREPGGQFFSRAGQYFDDSTVMRYVHFLSASWQRGAWTAQLTHHYRSGYTDCNAQCDIDPQFFNNVAAYSVFDLSGIYQWHNVMIAATIKNMFNKEPPFTNGSSGISTNWDDRYSDPLQRTYLLTVSWKL